MRFLILILMACLGGLIGCTHDPAPVLRVGANVWPGYEPLYLARDLNYLPATIHPVEFHSATQVIRAYQNGSVDAVCLTLDEALLLASQGEDFRIVRVADFSNGADAIIGTIGMSGMADLKGKRVGAENTALGAYFLARALQESGLHLADVRVVPTQVQDHEQVFSKGMVDAVVTFEPVRGKLVARGAPVLFDSSHIPGEIVDVVLVRADFLRYHPGVVAGLLRGWQQAQDYMTQSRDDALGRIARREGVTVAEISAALKGMHLPGREENLRLLTGSAPALQPMLQRLASFMSQQQLLVNKIQVDRLIEPRDFALDPS